MPPKKDEDSELEERMTRLEQRIDALDSVKEQQEQIMKRLDKFEKVLIGLSEKILGQTTPENPSITTSPVSTTSAPPFPPIPGSPITVTTTIKPPPTVSQKLPTGTVPPNHRRRSIKVTEVKHTDDEDVETVEKTIDVLEDSESESRGTKLPPIPKFSCEKPGDATFWTQVIWRYMKLARIPEEKAVEWAGMTLPQKQNLWYLNWSKENPSTTWDEFVKALLDRYEPINHLDHATFKYNELRQGAGTAQEFYDKMIELLGIIPPVSEESKIDKFITGLCISTRRRVLEIHQERSQRTFLAVAHTAIQYEETRKLLLDDRYDNRSKPKFSNKKFTKNYKYRVNQASNGGPSSPSNSAEKGPGKSGQCHICGDKNHWARQCPQRDKPKPSSGTTTASSSTSSSSTPTPATPVVTTTVKKMNLLCDGEKLRLLTLRARIGDRLVSCLLDPGAECSIVSPQLVEELKLSTKDVSPVIISGITGDVQVTSRTTLDLKFGSTSAPISAYCLERKPWEVVLGLDWVNTLDSVTWRKGMATLRFMDGTELEVKVQETKPEFLRTKKLKSLLRKNKKVYIALVQSEVAQLKMQATDASSRRQRILEKWRDTVFRDDLPEGLPQRSEDMKHEIKLVEGATPISRAYYRLTESQRQELDRQLAYLLEKGFVRPSKSPYGAPVLFAPKPDGTWRFCIDYRALNQQTIRDQFPLPIIDDLIDRLQGAKCFSKLDLKYGYWQIEVKDEDIYKTAFRTEHGLFEWTVLPMGLTNAPAAFMRIMSNLFKDFSAFVVVYLDDLLIFSKSEEEHERHLEMVLQRLKENKLYVKMAKCDLFVGEAEFLGYLVSSHGVAVQQKKIERILNWPTPTNQTELRGFLGLASFYRKFVHRFSEIAAPLHKLTGKNTPWKWSEEAQTAFDDLKTALTTTPVLTIPDLSKPFILTTDASGVGLGAVLSQHTDAGEKPVAFFSRKLNEHEVKYDIYTQELLAVVSALKEWRHYLEAPTSFETLIRTDQEALKYLQSQKHLTGKLAGWLNFLANYNFKVQHIPGSKNRVADALSRFSFNTITVTQALTDEQLDFRGELYEGEDHYIYLLHNSLTVKSKDLLDIQITPDQYSAADRSNYNSPKFYQRLGLYYKTHSSGIDRLCIPKNTESLAKILNLLHDHPTSGHLGIQKTLERAKRRFYWPRMADDINSYVGTCLSCQRVKSTNQKPLGLLHPLPIPSQPWESVAIDFITGFPTTNSGFDSVLTITDRLSKMVKFVPVQKDITAEQTVNILVERLVADHGLPKQIVCDRDPKFKAELFRCFAERFGINLNMSTAYHPQTDGQSERTNRTLEDMLRHYVGDKSNDWDEHLPMAQFAVNDMFQSSTGNSPFNLVYTYQPRAPADLITGIHKHATAERQAQDVKKDIEQAKESISKAQQRMKYYADQSRKDYNFQEGDKVMLSTQDLQLAYPKAKKFQPRYIGPYTITKKLSDVTFSLELPSTMGIHPNIHVSRLIPARDKDEFGRQLPPPPPVEVEGEQEYIIKKILDSKTWGRGKRYLVLWQGYDDPTWVPGSLLQDAEALDDFEREIASGTKQLKKGDM